MIDGKKRPFAGCFSEGVGKHPCQLVFAGLPDDSQSSHRRGCSNAPDRLRFAYDGNAFGATTELGVDLTKSVLDLGNIPSENSWPTTAEKYTRFAENLFRENKIPFFAGGDHAVTVPVVRGLRVIGKPIHVIQIDAHPDLYPEYEGSRTSHACTAARLLEMDHVVKMTQIGIRTLNAPQARVAKDHCDKVEMVTCRDFSLHPFKMPPLARESPVYITLDLDGLDPAFAPGVSHPVPGGLTSRAVIDLIHHLPGLLVGMDVVEVNPDLDINDQTAILAARLLTEAMGKALLQRRSS